jgi:signal transduction histidine kinase
MQHSPTKRLLIGFAITLLAAILYSGYTLRQVRILRALQTETVDRNRKDSLQLLRIQNSLNSLAVSFRDMLSGEEPYPLEAYAPQVQRIRADLEDALRIEDTLLPHARRSAQQHSVASALKAFWQGTDAMFALAREHHEAEARDMLRGALQSQETALTAMIARLLVENNSSEEQATGSIHQIYDRVERNLYGFLIAELLAILATSITMVYFNRRIFHDLESLSAQKTTLARKLISVQEEVLRSVSRELHDEFGQILTAIGTLLARAERKAIPADSPLREALLEVQQITQETLEKTRTLSHALHPGILDDYGLEKAIEWYVPIFQRQTGIEVSYQKQGDGSSVPEQAAIHVYRILQEALNNVARHSGSKTAAVRMEYGARRLALEVEDQGSGLPEPGNGGFSGLGLVAMRERADLLNATLKVENGVRGGTVVRLDVPVDGDLEDNASHE